MKQSLWLCVAAALATAVSAPAQVVVEARFGDHLRGAVVVGRDAGPVVRSAPAPVRRPGRAQRGSWQLVQEQVLVPGYWHERQVPPTYGWVFDRRGRRSWGIVAAGGCQRVWVPARWETRTRRVWVPC